MIIISFHSENITRYKKILQIANNIIEEIRFKTKDGNLKLLNLRGDLYTGTVEFDSEKELPYQINKTKKGFPSELLTDTQRIPVTEDYTDIHTYLAYVENNKFADVETDVFINL